VGFQHFEDDVATCLWAIGCYGKQSRDYCLLDRQYLRKELLLFECTSANSLGNQYGVDDVVLRELTLHMGVSPLDAVNEIVYVAFGDVHQQLVFFGSRFSPFDMQGLVTVVGRIAEIAGWEVPRSQCYNDVVQNIPTAFDQNSVFFLHHQHEDLFELGEIPNDVGWLVLIGAFDEHTVPSDILLVFSG